MRNQPPEIKPMRQYLEIGPVPCEEECAQVGQDDYHERARPECIRFIKAIRATVGAEPEGASLVVKSNPHDFGSYLEVAVRYDEDVPGALDYALKVEAEAPANWPEGV
jgi:hypothetical protein